MDHEVLRLSGHECEKLLDRLFPDGPNGPSVLAEIAPEGWTQSPLLAIYHPSAKQVYEERVRGHRNLTRLIGRRGGPIDRDDTGEARQAPERPEPTPEEVRASHTPTPVDQEREVEDLVGRCLWDVFSDNHDVLASDGRVADLGSFRGSAGLIADWLNGKHGISPLSAEDCIKRVIEQSGRPREASQREPAAEHRPPWGGRYDYMDYYMGTGLVPHRADLHPVYAMIFRRLREAGGDWVYHFPRLNIVDLRPIRDALEDRNEEADLHYDPAEAFAKQQEEEERDRQVQEMRENLEEAHRDAVDAARQRPPPPIVKAYRSVCGKLPRGWPPRAE